MIVDSRLSMQLGLTIGAIVGECFDNAREGAELLRSRDLPAVYVEGMACAGPLLNPDGRVYMPDVPMPHAWIELHGVIVDPTPCVDTNGHIYRWGWHSHDAKPGSARPGKISMAELRKRWASEHDATDGGRR